MKPMLWPLLGLVRFFLALVVAGTHLAHFAPGNAIAHWFDGLSAFVAVIGFLIVSGFSIAASYEKSPAGFYGRRVLRILPLYVLAIAAAAFCTMPFGGKVVFQDSGVLLAPSSSSVLQNLFFLQGFVVPRISTNPVVWSLSIEVAFYLLTPLIARLSQVALSCIAAASLLLFVASCSYSAPNFPMMVNGLSFALLAWCWLAGFIVYRARNHLAAAFVLFVVLDVALTAVGRLLPDGWRVTAIAVMVAIGFGSMLRAPAWFTRACGLAGDASYPLYLFHWPVFVMLCGFGVPHAGVIYLPFAVLASFALDRWFDQPVKKLTKLRIFRPKISLAPKPA